MIAKLKSNKNLKATISYNLKADSEIIDAYNLVGNCIDDYRKQMELTQGLFQGRAKNLTAHIILSPSIQDGEKLDKNDWCDIARSYVEKTAFDKNECIVFLHVDKGHKHLHIVANRINEGGKIYRNGFELHLSQRIGNEIAAERGMMQAREVKIERNEQDQDSFSEGLLNKIRQDVNEALQKTTKNGAEFNRWIFFKTLENLGQEILLQFGNFRKKFKEIYDQEEIKLITGFGVKSNGRYYSASQLGREFTLSSLESKGDNKAQLISSLQLITRGKFKTRDEYFKALENAGYEVIVHRKEDGEIRGYAIQRNGQRFNASDLGREFALKQLENTGTILADEKPNNTSKEKTSNRYRNQF